MKRIKRPCALLLAIVLVLGIVIQPRIGRVFAEDPVQPENVEQPVEETVEETTPEVTEEPTPVPTEVPTPVPTEVPTPVPTEVPTPVPTEVPTPVPTEVPTPVPTEVPTPVPTEVPTPVPTEVPAPVQEDEPEAVEETPMLPFYERLMACGTLADFEALLCAGENRAELEALSQKELLRLLERVEEIFAAIEEPAEDDAPLKEKLLKKLNEHVIVVCSECGGKDGAHKAGCSALCTCGGKGGAHAEDCPLYVPPVAIFPEQVEENGAFEADGSASVPACTCGSEDGEHAEDCPLYAPAVDTCPECGGENGAHEEGCTAVVPACTCGSENGAHAEDCPLYVPAVDACPACGGENGEHAEGCTALVPECTCGSEDGEHAEDCPLYAPAVDVCPECGGENGAHEEGCTALAPVCTCGSENGEHAEDCPLYVPAVDACPACGGENGAHEEGCTALVPVCTCGSENGEHAEDCPLYVPAVDVCPECGGENGEHAEGCTALVPVCTCGSENGEHAEDCPLYAIAATVCSECGEANGHAETCSQYTAEAESFPGAEWTDAELAAWLMDEANADTVRTILSGDGSEEYVSLNARVEEILTGEDNALAEQVGEYLTALFETAEETLARQFYEQLLACETLADFDALLCAEENAVALEALTPEELGQLVARVEELCAAIEEPTEDDALLKEELLNKLNEQLPVICPECGEANGHAETCSQYIAEAENFPWTDWTDAELAAWLMDEANADAVLSILSGEGSEEYVSLNARVEAILTGEDTALAQQVSEYLTALFETAEETLAQQFYEQLLACETLADFDALLRAEENAALLAGMTPEKLLRVMLCAEELCATIAEATEEDALLEAELLNQLNELLNTAWSEWTDAEFAAWLMDAANADIVRDVLCSEGEAYAALNARIEAILTGEDIALAEQVSEYMTALFETAEETLARQFYEQLLACETLADFDALLRAEENAALLETLTPEKLLRVMLRTEELCAAIAEATEEDALLAAELLNQLNELLGAAWSEWTDAELAAWLMDAANADIVRAVLRSEGEAYAALNARIEAILTGEDTALAEQVQEYLTALFETAEETLARHFYEQLLACETLADLDALLRAEENAALLAGMTPEQLLRVMLRTEELCAAIAEPTEEDALLEAELLNKLNELLGAAWSEWTDAEFAAWLMDAANADIVRAVLRSEGGAYAALNARIETILAGEDIALAEQISEYLTALFETAEETLARHFYEQLLTCETLADLDALLRAEENAALLAGMAPENLLRVMLRAEELCAAIAEATEEDALLEAELLNQLNELLGAAWSEWTDAEFAAWLMDAANADIVRAVLRSEGEAYAALNARIETILVGEDTALAEQVQEYLTALFETAEETLARHFYEQLLACETLADFDALLRAEENAALRAALTPGRLLRLMVRVEELGEELAEPTDADALLAAELLKALNEQLSAAWKDWTDAEFAAWLMDQANLEDVKAVLFSEGEAFDVLFARIEAILSGEDAELAQRVSEYILALFEVNLLAGTEEYIYFDLAAGDVNFSPSEYSGSVYVNGIIESVKGTHNTNNKYYIYINPI